MRGASAPAQDFIFTSTVRGCPASPARRHLPFRHAQITQLQLLPQGHVAHFIVTLIIHLLWNASSARPKDALPPPTLHPGIRTQTPHPSTSLSHPNHQCGCPIHTAFFAGWVGTTKASPVLVLAFLSVIPVRESASLPQMPQSHSAPLEPDVSLINMQWRRGFAFAAVHLAVAFSIVALIEADDSAMWGYDQ